MSYVGKNIKHIRTVRKLSQADFAKLFNLARPSVGAYEEGRSEPKIQTLLDIAQKFGLSVDLLLTKELTVNDLYKLDMVNEKLDQVHGGKPVQRAVVKTDSIGLVRSASFPEYVANHQKKDFVNALPPVDMPLSFKGEARAFEMYGREMDYNQSGLHHGDLLLCKKEEIPSATTLISSHVYIVVTRDQVFIRRLKSVSANKMSMISDDPNYSELTFDLEQDVQEVWEVKGVYSTYLNPPKVVDEKVMLLEKTVSDLVARMNRLEAK